MANASDPRLIDPGRPDFGAMLSSTGEAEPFEVPRAPKRAASSTFDYWFENCGHVVSPRNGEAFSQQSTPWTKDLAQWTREAERSDGRERLRRALHIARFELDYLSECLAATPTGRMMHKRRKTAEMNARYVRRDGKRKYIGKKVVDARKAKRAAAARDRRTREWVESHVVDLPSNVQLSQ